MTAPGALEAAPGSAASARRPAGAGWALPLIALLAALLALLPCAGSAMAAAPSSPPPSHSVTAPSAPTARPAAPRVTVSAVVRDTPSDKAYCSSEDAPLPGPGHGCSGDSWCAQQAQLPNAPPQTGPAALPRLVPPCPAPVAAPVVAAAWPAPTPDLHLLQVNRP
jgi:hypothetical protein